MQALRLADPDTLDLVLDEQLTTLQFGDLQIICGRMGHRLRDLVFESTMLPLQFCKMRLYGHVEWLLETISANTPDSLSVPCGSSQVDCDRSCAMQKFADRALPAPNTALDTA